ncbi:MFS transporter [Phytohabitans kaempferiae]|uniref:Sugar MFS transporter n=1 Tax=Phytohabitans kaempferiae TaxID=1620943 RepID=A0ABV6M085_9ACTN
MPPLVRDRVTLLTYAQLGLWGFFLYGFGPVVPLLRDEQGTTAAVASLHSTGLAVGALLGASAFPWLAGRLGRGGVLWLALAGLAVAVGVLGAFEVLPATLTAAVLAATFGTMVVSGVNAALADQHGAGATAAISEANAVAAGAGVVAPIVIGLSVSAGLGWRPGIAVVVGLIALVFAANLLFRVRLPSSAAAPAVVSAGRPLPRTYWLAWAMLAATGSVEVCLSLWAADVLRTHAGMAPGAASATVAAIVGGMFAGRLVGSALARRVAAVPLLLGALAVSVVGFAIFWLSAVPWAAAVGLMVLGVGNAMHYPLGVSLALAVAEGQRDRASAYSMYSGAIGFGVAPVVLGWVADEVGPHRAFLLLPAFIAVAAVLAVRLRRAHSAAVPDLAGGGPLVDGGPSSGGGPLVGSPVADGGLPLGGGQLAGGSPGDGRPAGGGGL